MKNLLCLFFYTGLTALTAHAAPSGENLSLDTYLSQVEGGNREVQASQEGSRGAELAAHESKLLTLPQFVANAQWLSDQRQSPFFPYQKLVTDAYSFGFSQTSSFGLRSSLTYSINHTNYVGLRPDYYEGSPRLELSLSLWRNFLGSETRATQNATEASALSAKFSQSFVRKLTRADAEVAYIQLAAARELLEVNENSLQRAQELYSWSNRRMKSNLGEDSDLFQAEANLEIRRLAIQTSRDQIRSASRAFNHARGIDSDEVAETVRLPATAEMEAPSRVLIRDDVQSAMQQQRLAAAQAALGIERNSPTLELYGAYARNSFQSSRGSAFSQSFSPDQPTRVIGIRFATPLAFGIASDVRTGFAHERSAAEISADQKLFDQENEWKDLLQRFDEAKSRLQLAERIAAIQKRKSLNESRRLTRGRTTTYQNLTFETEFNQAEASRIQAQSEVLSIRARMKTFGG